MWQGLQYRAALNRVALLNFYHACQAKIPCFKGAAQTANVRTHLTGDEVFEILELARQTNARARAIFVLAFNHGLRVTEVLNLRLNGDINWKDGTIRIARLKGTMTTTQALMEMRGK